MAGFFGRTDLGRRPRHAETFARAAAAELDQAVPLARSAYKVTLARNLIVGQPRDEELPGTLRRSPRKAQRTFAGPGSRTAERSGSPHADVPGSPG